MMNSKMNVSILCGEKGVGKSTYASSKWKKSVLLNCNDPRCRLTTIWIVENALTETFGITFCNQTEIINKLSLALQDGYAVIFDCAEQIEDNLLITILNSIKFISNTELVFIFDIDKRHIFENRIFRMLIDWEVVSINKQIENYTTEPRILDSFIDKNLPHAGKDLLQDIRELCNGNFNSLKKLIWLVNNRQNNYERITNDVVSTYFYSIVEDKFRGLPDGLFDVLKKSSIIGNIFHSYILDSPDGFSILGVKAYLDKLEEMNILIHKYLNEPVYEFYPEGIREGVLKFIEPHEKAEYEKILCQYYIVKLELENNINKKIEYLWKIKKLSLSLNDSKTVFSANRSLLYLYIGSHDEEKARTICEEILKYCKNDASELFRLLSFYSVKINISLGYNYEALDVIENLRKVYPNNTSLYQSYFYAKCLYNCGKTDEAYAESINLVARLKQTSGKSANNQPIYALTYSLIATIQHHLNINDKGFRYYRLALNHAKNKLLDKDVYYEILSKCDMYFDYQKIKTELVSCVEYFELSNKLYQAAKIYLNLATEIMFNDSNEFGISEKYLKKSVKYFEDCPNERLSYVRNNFAIYYVLSSNNIKLAIDFFESALLLGMSSFTYMTIYLNLCMCNLNLYGCNDIRFKNAYIKFMDYYHKIKLRKYATQYEEIYKFLLDIIVLEYSGNVEEIRECEKKMPIGTMPSFFLPIVNDIIRRNLGTNSGLTNYSDNEALYKGLNRNRIFLAEFRFWE